MVSRAAVEDQLHRIRFNYRAWGRSEVNELYQILMDDERISECVNGEYNGGFALLLATNHRVLLIDKKPFLYLSVEDLRFDTISDFYFHNKMIFADVTISSTGKTLQFRSWDKRRLRNLLNCIQQRVIDLRQNQHMAQQFEAATIAHLQTLARQTSAAQPAQAQADFVPSSSQVIQAEPSSSTRSFGERASRLATYTRGKMPSFRHYRERPPVAYGEVYPQGYGSNAVQGGAGE